MNNFTLSAPLVKIDEERRIIVARAAQEVPDKSKEIMDYESGKSQFEAWSNEISTLSGGLSKGNVRAMHRKDSASGKVTELSFNDDDKAVDVMIKVVDDADWKKCLEGVYTGISIGGGYLKKWKDGDLTRYTPIIREISLVDNPCIPTARFVELVKANGSTETLELKGVVKTFSQQWTERPTTFQERWDNRPKTFSELFGSQTDGLTKREYKRDKNGKFSNTSALASTSEGAIGGATIGSFVTKPSINMDYIKNTMANSSSSVGGSLKALGRIYLKSNKKLIPFALAGGALGYLASRRLRNNESGKQSSAALNIAAHTGNVVRVVGDAGYGGAFGGIFGNTGRVIGSAAGALVGLRSIRRENQKAEAIHNENK